MNIDYKHEWQVDRSAWYIKFYVWLYEASLYDINFCKLFWGYVFCVPILILRGILTPVVLLFANLEDRRKKPSPTPEERFRIIRERRQADAERQEYKKANPGWAMRFLTRVSHGFSQLLMVVSSFWSWVTANKKLTWFVTRTLLALAVLVGLGAGGLFIYLVVTNLSTTVIVLGIGLAVVLTVLFLWMLKLVGVWDALHGRVLKPTGEGLKSGGLTFRQAMKAGFIAVKSNTCPKVVVIDPDEKNSDRVLAT